MPNDAKLREIIRYSMLSWQERVRAINNFHELQKSQSPNHTAQQTANLLEIPYHTVIAAIKISQHLDDPTILSSNSLNKALDILSQRAQNKSQILNDILIETSNEISKTAEAPQDLPSSPALKPQNRDIKILDFDFPSWAESYHSTPFSTIHMDGEFIQHLTTLAKYKSKIILPSAHMLVWTHTRNLDRTLSILSNYFPEFKFSPEPLLWVQTNIIGQNYMNAIFGSSNDRPLVKSLTYTYTCPLARDDDFSEPMLKYFLSFFCNEASSLFDPFCRAGASILAADSIKISRALGLTQGNYFLEAANSLRSRKIRENMRKDLNDVVV